jgi:hypothetical protein
LKKAGKTQSDDVDASQLKSAVEVHVIAAAVGRHASHEGRRKEKREGERERGEGGEREREREGERRVARGR